MYRNLLKNVVTITEDDGTYTADKSYLFLQRGLARGTGVICLFDGKLIPLQAIGDKLYFAAEIMGAYIMITIGSDGVTCTIDAGTSEEETTPEAETIPDSDETT